MQFFTDKPKSYRRLLQKWGGGVTSPHPLLRHAPDVTQQAMPAVLQIRLGFPHMRIYLSIPKPGLAADCTLSEREAGKEDHNIECRSFLACFVNSLRFLSDINECTRSPGICEYDCMNTEGSYKCACPPGYLSVGNNCEGN